MLTTKKSTGPVEAVLRVDMLIEGEECEAGEVVELTARDFKYLSHHNRVLEATKDNVAAVREEIKIKRDAAAKVAARADELTDTKNQLATALARIAELEKKGK